MLVLYAAAQIGKSGVMHNLSSGGMFFITTRAFSVNIWPPLRCMSVFWPAIMPPSVIAPLLTIRYGCVLRSFEITEFFCNRKELILQVFHRSLLLPSSAKSLIKLDQCQTFAELGLHQI